MAEQRMTVFAYLSKMNAFLCARTTILSGNFFSGSGIFLFSLVCFVFFTSSCTKDVGKKQIPVEEHGYPSNVGDIILTKCATSGCHNEKSSEAAGGLNLETWTSLFEGNRSGAVVIPYRPDHSTLMYFVNSYDEFGTIQLEPRMPLNQEALSKEEVKTLYDWIIQGAPDARGRIKFQDDPNRKKVYVANQGCDLVTVIDAQSMLAMRYVDVGETRGIEAPHMVKVAPDNQHWYVSFIAGGFFLKYRTSDNGLAGKVNLGVGSWNTFAISPDSKTAYVVDWSPAGKIAVVNLETMEKTLHMGYYFPHGSALGENGDILYVTGQYGNYIHKIDVTDFSSSKKITLDGNAPSDLPSLDAHEIMFSPDGSKYFVTCQGSNEVRVLNASDDNLVAVIPTGVLPQEMSVSKNKPYLFVTCMEDTSANKSRLSSVYVINYETNQVVKTIYAGFQSHGIAVDDRYNRVFVGNRNIFSNGPPPHHQSLCTGRNGYVTAIDLQTLEVIPGYKTEVSIDPYGVGISQ